VRVLIIDNASTDQSVEVAQQRAAEDPRMERSWFIDAI
jgi:glycosyltransferase involved in cell wall biosynthesis